MCCLYDIFFVFHIDFLISIVCFWWQSIKVSCVDSCNFQFTDIDEIILNFHYYDSCRVGYDGNKNRTPIHLSSLQMAYHSIKMKLLRFLAMISVVCVCVCVWVRVYVNYDLVKVKMTMTRVRYVNNPVDFQSGAIGIFILAIVVASLLRFVFPCLFAVCFFFVFWNCSVTV